MKRDMDLCREIMRQIEAHPEPWGQAAMRAELSRVTGLDL